MAINDFNFTDEVCTLYYLPLSLSSLGVSDTSTIFNLFSPPFVEEVIHDWPVDDFSELSSSFKSILNLEKNCYNKAVAN